MQDSHRHLDVLSHGSGCGLDCSHLGDVHMHADRSSLADDSMHVHITQMRAVETAAAAMRQHAKVPMAGLHA